MAPLMKQFCSSETAGIYQEDTPDDRAIQPAKLRNLTSKSKDIILHFATIKR